MPVPLFSSPAVKGKLLSVDAVASPNVLETAGGQNEAVQVKIQFQEFVRLEIGRNAASAKWYQISDNVDWQVVQRFRKLNSPPAPTSDGYGMTDVGSLTLDDNSSY